MVGTLLLYRDVTLPSGLGWYHTFEEATQSKTVESFGDCGRQEYGPKDVHMLNPGACEYAT